MSKELVRLYEIFNETVAPQLRKEGINWTFAAPASSEKMGCVERIIRAFRTCLFHVLKGQELSDDELATIITECENIINSRPLVPITDEPDSDILTPNHLLLGKCGESMPMGFYDEKDRFLRNKWRHVQFVTEQFWKQFSLHYFHYLHVRTKWFRPRRCLKVGDYVAIEDKNLPR